MPIKVLLVDDNQPTLLLWARIIHGACDMQVVGQASNGRDAVRMVEELHPDVVLMDVMMPVMNGLDATREIMSQSPTPIIVTSANFTSLECSIAFEAINAGAVSVVKKPGMTQSLSPEDSIKEFVNTVRAMAGVRVIRHRKADAPVAENELVAPVAACTNDAKPEIVAIAVSTGGPQTLAKILANVPATFQLPIVVVQHIAEDFVSSLVSWLNTVSRLPVCVARAGEAPRAGTVYIAPGGVHLQLTADHRFALTDAPAKVAHIPSGDVLLASVAKHYGAHAIGIVLTGMGSDGAHGLRAMRDAEAMTIAQDEASCIIFGMPQEAIALGAARLTLPPPAIAKFLEQYSN